MLAAHDRVRELTPLCSTHKAVASAADALLKMRPICIGHTPAITVSFTRTRPILTTLRLQGAFRKVTAEADACAKDMTATLRGRLQGNAIDPAECIQLMRQLGEPIENLQV